MKLLTIFVCICLVLSLTACGNTAAGGETPETPETTQGVLPQETQEPNENQCAGDPTLSTEEEEYPTEEPETTAQLEAPVEEENEEPLGEEPEEEEPGDIQIPMDEIQGYTFTQKEK